MSAPPNVLCIMGPSHSSWRKHKPLSGVSSEDYPFPVSHAFLTHVCCSIPLGLEGLLCSSLELSLQPSPLWYLVLVGSPCLLPFLGDHCLVLPTFQCQTTIVSYILRTLLLLLFHMKVISVPVTPSWLEAKVLQWFNKYFEAHK